MDKIFSTEFELDDKKLLVLYMCYKFKFPASYMLSFYELYEEKSLFTLKALACTKDIKLTDQSITKMLEESRKLYKQILRGRSIRNEIKESKIKLKKEIEKARLLDLDLSMVSLPAVPEEPTINTEDFSSEYKDFLENYLLRNVEDITFRNCNIGLTTDTVIAFLHGYQALNVTLESCTLDAQAQVLNGIVDLGGTQAYEYGLSLIDCVVKNYGNSSQSSTFPISIFTNNYPSSLSRIKVYNLTFDGAGQQGYSKTYNFGTTQMQNVLYLDPLKYDPYNP